MNGNNDGTTADYAMHAAGEARDHARDLERRVAQLETDSRTAGTDGRTTQAGEPVTEPDEELERAEQAYERDQEALTEAEQEEAKLADAEWIPQQVKDYYGLH